MESCSGSKDNVAENRSFCKEDWDCKTLSVFSVGCHFGVDI